MATVTKKELIDTIATATKQKRVVVKKVVQSFLDNIIVELGQGNRLEFRDFGVFEVKRRKARRAQNPKTLEPVQVPSKRTVKFKVGRLMKQTLTAQAEAEFRLRLAGSGDGISDGAGTSSPGDDGQAAAAAASGSSSGGDDRTTV